MTTVTRPRTPAPAAARRRWVGPALLALLIVGAIVVGGWWGSRVRPPAPLPSEAVAWESVVAGLDSVRDAALRTGDTTLLRSVHTATGTSVQADLELAAVLADRGLTPGPTATEIVAVRELSVSGDAAVLEVDDVLAGIDLVGPDGVRTLRQPARGERTWRVELRRVDGAWRYEAISDAAPAGGRR